MWSKMRTLKSKSVVSFKKVQLFYSNLSEQYSIYNPQRSKAFTAENVLWFQF